MEFMHKVKFPVVSSETSDILHSGNMKGICTKSSKSL